MSSTSIGWPVATGPRSSALLRRAEEADDDPPLPEPERLAITGGEPTHGRAVVAHGVDHLDGAGFLFPARDGTVTVHVVVDPDRRSTDTGDLLVAGALAAAPPGAPVHLWAMAAGPRDDARAARHGFTPDRDLLQMRVALPLDASILAATRPLRTRPFEPGRDDEAWVETNNAAFAEHPEQGGWTVDQLRRRMAASWVELDGFLVADEPDGTGLIGFCWTKVHRDHDPVLGEIYVIAAHPRHHGQGLGRSLTVAGLESLAGRGIGVGMLYADADNAAAVGLYRSLGFTVHHVDRSYRRDPASG